MNKDHHPITINKDHYPITSINKDHHPITRINKDHISLQNLNKAPNPRKIISKIRQTEDRTSHLKKPNQNELNVRQVIDAADTTNWLIKGCRPFADLRLQSGVRHQNRGKVKDLGGRIRLLERMGSMTGNISIYLDNFFSIKIFFCWFCIFDLIRI